MTTEDLATTDHAANLWSALTPHWRYCDVSEFTDINGDYLYLVPESSPPKKCVIRYEDENVVVVSFLSKGTDVSGFAVRVLREDGFAIIDQQHAVMLADLDSTRHWDPKYVVDTPNIRVIKAQADGSVGVSYWVSVKRKETCL